MAIGLSGLESRSGDGSGVPFATRVPTPAPPIRRRNRRIRRARPGRRAPRDANLCRARARAVGAAPPSLVAAPAQPLALAPPIFRRLRLPAFAFVCVGAALDLRRYGARAMSASTSLRLALALALLPACSPSSSTTDATQTGGGTTTTDGTGGAGQGGATSSQGGGAQGGAGHGGGATSSQGGGAQGGGGTTSSSTTGRCSKTTFGGERPVELHVPAGFQCGNPAPLLFMLHGYESTGSLEEAYFGFEKVADEKGFFYAHPEGTVDSTGMQFWNATDACCNFYGSSVDDSTYLVELIDQIAQEWDIDPKRVYLFGHSNGAFMAYRMACDHADRFAAVGGLAGAMFDDPTKCKATEPVSVLAIHGTNDVNISYYGGVLNMATYPGAVETVEDWATIDGCDAKPTSGDNVDVDALLFGDETTVSTYGGCKAGATVELRSIFGGLHIPTLSATFTPSVVDWMLAQHKP
jgi:polyhydroxybutyrate depolymerase